MRQDFAALGSLAPQRLLLATEGEEVVAHDRIQPLLVERASTGPPASPN